MAVSLLARILLGRSIYIDLIIIKVNCVTPIWSCKVAGSSISRLCPRAVSKPPVSVWYQITSWVRTWKGWHYHDHKDQQVSCRIFNRVQINKARWGYRKGGTRSPPPERGETIWCLRDICRDDSGECPAFGGTTPGKTGFCSGVNDKFNFQNTPDYLRNPLQPWTGRSGIRKRRYRYLSQNTLNWVPGSGMRSNLNRRKDWLWERCFSSSHINLHHFWPGHNRSLFRSFKAGGRSAVFRWGICRTGLG